MDYLGAVLVAGGISFALVASLQGTASQSVCALAVTFSFDIQNIFMCVRRRARTDGPTAGFHASTPLTHSTPLAIRNSDARRAPTTAPASARTHAIIAETQTHTDKDTDTTTTATATRAGLFLRSRYGVPLSRSHHHHHHHHHPARLPPFCPPGGSFATTTRWRSTWCAWSASAST